MVLSIADIAIASPEMRQATLCGSSPVSTLGRKPRSQCQGPVVAVRAAVVFKSKSCTHVAVSVLIRDRLLVTHTKAERDIVCVNTMANCGGLQRGWPSV